MIPLTILYDEYIDRSKLTEQKNPVGYIVPPSPLKWGSEQLSEMEDKFEEQKSMFKNKCLSSILEQSEFLGLKKTFL